MRLGIFTAVFGPQTLDEVIVQVQKLGISTVELGTGGYPGDPHCKLSILEDAAARGAFQKKLADNGISISALSCHGNPLHPVKELREKFVSTSRRTILLAEKLGVRTVIDFSGCPGDSDQAKFPNWVTCPWPPDFTELLKWQWEQKALPFWVEQAKFARDHGARIAIEMHPGFLAYSPETLLRLRAAAGDNVGCNFDPSHLFWQGIDPTEAVRSLGSLVYNAAAKDTRINALAKVNGALDDSFTHVGKGDPGWLSLGGPHSLSGWPKDSSWDFVAVGRGHDVSWWAGFLAALEAVDPDMAVNIEHEDTELGQMEGLRYAADTLLQAARRKGQVGD